MEMEDQVLFKFRGLREDESCFLDDKLFEQFVGKE